ncbi:MAG: DNA internalization-related competence protein ComEC/Rec2 [bacterium]
MNNKPIVYLTIAFSLGITVSKLIAMPLWLLLLSLTIFLGVSIAAYFQKLKLDWFLLLLIFLLGAFMFQLKSLPAENGITSYINNGYLTVVGVVDDAPKVKEKGLFFPFKVREIIKGGEQKRASGNIFVFIREREAKLDYGDKISVRGAIQDNGMIFAEFYEKLPGNVGNPLKKVAIWFSQRFNEVLNKILPAKEASLLGSILLGSSVSPLDAEVKDSYRQAGLIHLLVVSGTQVSILIGVGLAIFRAAQMPLWLSVVSTSFLNLMLVVVTGGGASILRASIMGEITLLGLLFEREKEFYTALSLSALVLLLFDPTTLFDIGFQLSFTATWALVYIAPVMEKKLPPMIAVSLAPIMATSPLIALYFSQISPGAIISNLLVLPWVEFLVILGFGTTLLGFVFLPLAQILGNTIWLMLIALDKISWFVSLIPLSYFYIATPSIVLIGGYYLGLISLIEALRKDEKIRITKKKLIFGVTFLLVIIVWNWAFAPAKLLGRELVVTFIDVGQGDATLIETPEGKKILIDGGGSEGKKEVDPIGSKVLLPFLQKKGINSLDLVIATHPHNDHIGGLNVVLDKIKTEAVIDNGAIFDSQVYRRFKELIDLNRIKYSAGRAGETLSLGQDINATILSPFDPLLNDTNSDSIVIRLAYKNISFMLTGDLGFPGEERVLNYAGGNLGSTILKVGHHGSATSSSAEFLAMVKPKIAVIPVGKNNRYRHPTKAALMRLADCGAKVYRTDEVGSIVVRTNGTDLVIEPRKE